MTKKQLAEMLADTWQRGYNDAIETLKDAKENVPRETMVKMFHDSFKDKTF